MSRAFVKEDVDPPERSGRARSASGLPPGAINYITALGAARLQAELNELRRASAGETGAARVAELERVLASVTIVGPPDDPDSIAFGAKVSLCNAAGELVSYRIVGVDELHLFRDGITWVSPLGKALLAAEVGERVALPESDERVQIVNAEYPHD